MGCDIGGSDAVRRGMKTIDNASGELLIQGDKERRIKVSAFGGCRST